VGKYSDVYNQAECKTCNNGEYAVEESTSCTDCAPGTYHESTGGVCKDCVSGKYQNNAGQVICSNCSKGTHHSRSLTNGIEHDEHCETCPAGKFQDAVGQLVCNTCPSGQFTNNFTASYNAQWSVAAYPALASAELPFETCHQCKVHTAQVGTGASTTVPLREWWTEGNDNSGEGWNRCVQKPVNCARGPWSVASTCTKSCKANHHAAQHVDHLSNEQSQLDRLGETLRDPLSTPWDDASWSPYGTDTAIATPIWTAWGGLEAASLPANAGATAGAACPGSHTPTFCSDTKYTHFFGYGGDRAYNGSIDTSTTDKWGNGGITVTQLNETTDQHGTRLEPYFHSSVVFVSTASSGDLGDAGVWTHEERCNTHNCPIDCVVSPWTEWNTCNHAGAVKKCDGGLTTRTRTTVQAAAHGGKICPASLDEKDCNTHSCTEAVCHVKHVRCKLNYVSYATQPSGVETAAAEANNARTSTCKHSLAPYGSTPKTLFNIDGVTALSTRGDGSSNYNCHRCDTEFECQQKQINRVIEIIHDKRFSHVGYNKQEQSKFICKIVDGRDLTTSDLKASHMGAYWLSGNPVAQQHQNHSHLTLADEVEHFTTRGAFSFRTSNKHKLTDAGQSRCECRCTHHPVGCFRKNWMFGGDLRQGPHKYIDGNSYTGIVDKEHCSGLCSHHPECKLWEFKLPVAATDGGRCILRTNTATQVNYVQNTDTAAYTTYAGVSSHNSAACLFHDRPTLCPYGKYVWTEQATDKKYCLNCEAGKFTLNGSNNDQCYSKSDLEIQMGVHPAGHAQAGQPIHVHPSAYYTNPTETQYYKNRGNASINTQEDNHGTGPASTDTRTDAGPFSMTPWL